MIHSISSNLTMDFQALTKQLINTENYFKAHAARAINRYLTARNWLFGYYIVEYEQQGKDRSTYGSRLFESLSEKLSIKGLSSARLKLFRQFYQTYPQIRVTLSREFQSVELQSLSEVDDSKEQVSSDDTELKPLDGQMLLENLSFSHFVELIKLDDPLKRRYYEMGCIQGTWSVRELKRQIATMTYERSACASDPVAMSKKLGASNDKVTPKELIKNPYVFDFLDLPDLELGGESKLESALISDLRAFMLELGYGFCFEAQQKRIVIGGEYFFIDLVFYHRVLKCHVLIELKVDNFNHEHIGQLNTYLQYYKKKEQLESDNPPIGILLCTKENNKELIEFALGGMDENLFVKQYQTALPSKEQLQLFLKEKEEEHKT